MGESVQNIVFSNQSKFSKDISKAIVKNLWIKDRTYLYTRSVRIRNALIRKRCAIVDTRKKHSLYAV